MVVNAISIANLSTKGLIRTTKKHNKPDVTTAIRILLVGTDKERREQAQRRHKYMRRINDY